MQISICIQALTIGWSTWANNATTGESKIIKPVKKPEVAVNLTNQFYHIDLLFFVGQINGMPNSNAKCKVFSNDFPDTDFLSFKLISFITFMVF